MKPEIVILERIDTSEIKIISKFAEIKFLVGLPRKKYLEKIKLITNINDVLLEYKLYNN